MFGILEIALFNKISLSWQDKRMEVFFFFFFFFFLPAPVKSVCSLKNTRRSRIKSRAEKLGRNLAVDFNMNIIFPSNSNNNADGCFKLHRYTEVCFFICTTMGNLRICSCLACVYRVMDARGKFGEHERCVRVARGDSRVQL